MSAVVALVNLNGDPVAASSLRRMLAVLSHRGTDAGSVFALENAGLGHALRVTTPESRYEQLPLRSKESGIVLTCDARIDNRIELAKELGLQGENLAEIPDSVFILKAFERWGRNCVGRLLGDFVFAVWDPKTRELFCARDPLGVKHFYYCYRPGSVLALASESKALFTLEGVGSEIDRERIGHFLTLNFDDRESTFFSGIRRLPANSTMLLTDSAMRVEYDYWWPKSTRKSKLKESEEYTAEFKNLFQQAVVSRSRSAGPVSAMLSGGLDSSSIACVANQFLLGDGRGSLKTFSAVFPTISERFKRIDERHFMKSVVEFSKCESEFVNCDDNDPLADIEEMTWHLDQPVGVCNLYIDWNISRAANRAGSGILLSGVDGDSTVSHGYEELGRYVRRLRLLKMLGEVRGLRRNMPSAAHGYKSLFWDLGFCAAFPALEAMFAKMINRGAGANYGHQAPIADVLNPSFRRLCRIDGATRKSDESFQSSGDEIVDNHWQGLTGGLMSFSLETNELSTQAFGIEERFPFCDRDLIEFCISLPDGQRIRNGWTRSIFRHAMAEILPEDVRWRRSKASLSPGVRLNFLKYGAWRLERLLNNESGLIDEFVDVPTVKSLYELYKRDPLQPGVINVILTNIVFLAEWLKGSHVVSQTT